MGNAQKTLVKECCAKCPSCLEATEDKSQQVDTLEASKELRGRVKNVFSARGGGEQDPPEETEDSESFRCEIVQDGPSPIAVAADLEEAEHTQTLQRMPDSYDAFDPYMEFTSSSHPGVEPQATAGASEGEKESSLTNSNISSWSLASEDIAKTPCHAQDGLCSSSNSLRPSCPRWPGFEYIQEPDGFQGFHEAGTIPGDGLYGMG